MKKSYRVEVEALAYFDIEANNPEEAKNKVPKSMQMSVEENSSVFFEEFDSSEGSLLAFCNRCIVDFMLLLSISKTSIKVTKVVILIIQEMYVDF